MPDWLVVHKVCDRPFAKKFGREIVASGANCAYHRFCIAGAVEVAAVVFCGPSDVHNFGWVDFAYEINMHVTLRHVNNYFHLFSGSPGVGVRHFREAAEKTLVPETPLGESDHNFWMV